MARGGKREGAGRPAGAIAKKTKELVEKIEASGLTPLDYMLNILRDESMDTESRFEAAKAAAPYVHPKLASVEHKGDADNPLQTISRIEIVPLTGNDNSED